MVLYYLKRVFMRIAIVQDELVRKGGAEQVVLGFHRAFPEAPIFTLCYNRKKTYPEFESCDIRTSWLGRVVKNEKSLKRLFYPFAIWAMRAINLKGYDVILQSTTHCAKYVRPDPQALVITYCHTPFRLAWRPESYKEIDGANPVMSRLYSMVIRRLRKIDRKAARRTDWFITNSREVVPRIYAAYFPRGKVTVINPGVKCANFYPSGLDGGYFLVVSRLEPYKKVDLVVEAFNRLPGEKLIIVGSGSREAGLKKKAGKNITFVSGLSAAELAEVYAGCKALIFPQLEDYGITPLEANASGKPVIAYGRGGVLDTMIPYQDDIRPATALFFNRQTVSALKAAVVRFGHLRFDTSFIRAHAEKFDESEFIIKIHNFISNTYKSNCYIFTCKH
ncbi:glycosyltransferase [Compostibacter hankyongensis]|uniref:Glycosyltransferase family 4 protein n=1 Tax=Compostibacter hankyongensis TaxID=1007089 RepID=A0ABP8G859_9BACT